MDLEMLLLAFAMFWKMSSAIRCYTCQPSLDSLTLNRQLCQNFDGSEHYITDCPHSTVCFKKETSLVGMEDPTKSISRGCAKQLMSGYQEKIDGHWHLIDKIHEHEAYTEGCYEKSNEFDRPTTTTNCFCRGDLCNNGVRTIENVVFISVLLLLVL
ncbi:uncharacterized protein LOC113226044 [Hyposmocoma kahamanoa]|uniref:uncharacterized protein LOC113226044 n=1 Tax=Hyposmocoma kahamanoa TaxID=1477025 RepID=UPI000E6D76AB|nr:uncharacterized protein LOC113226044 [Hyposmocoma kahamanoa]